MTDDATPTPVEELDDELAIEAEEPEGLDAETLERRQAFCVNFVSLSAGNLTQNGHRADSGRSDVPRHRRMRPFVAGVVPRPRLDSN